MNPLAKAIGAVFVLAAGTLGASLEETPIGLPFRPPGTSGDDAEDGNETSGGNQTDGNGTAEGNQTAEGNATAGGNETATEGNETTDGNQTADGNETTEEGNETSDREEDAEPAPDERSAVCSFQLYESGRDLASSRHEWEWRVTKDVQHLWVYFYGGDGVPTGLGERSSVRLIDGDGRTLAHSSSSDNMLQVFLERGVDAMSDGTWRLVYESSDAFAGYDVQVGLDCHKE